MVSHDLFKVLIRLSRDTYWYVYPVIWLEFHLRDSLPLLDGFLIFVILYVLYIYIKRAKYGADLIEINAYLVFTICYMLCYLLFKK